MADLEPLPQGRLDDVRAALRGLRPGKYRSFDLYTRYAEVVIGDRRQPVGRRWFGCMMRELGARGDTTYIPDEGRSLRTWTIGAELTGPTWKTTGLDTVSEMPSRPLP